VLNFFVSSKPTILLTGATGRLPSLLRVKWASEFEVIPFSRTPGKDLLPLEQLSDPHLLRNADAIVHAAWSTVPATAEENPQQSWQQDHPLLETICESLAATEKPPPLFFFSSGSVYGNCDGSGSVETDRPHPQSQYARAKREGEEILENRARETGFPLVILRISNVYGFPVREGRPQGVVSALLHSAATDSEFHLWGSGEEVKDYLHVDDLASAVASIFKNGMVSQSVCYNVASGCSASVLELIELVEKTSGRSLKISMDGQTECSGWDLERNLLDSDRLRRRTGWRPRFPLEAGIESEWRAVPRQEGF